MDAITSLAPRFAHYQTLALIQHGPILEIVMGAAQSADRELSTADASLHHELAEIWCDVSAKSSARVALVHGEGKDFSAGGDLHLVEQTADGFDMCTHVWHEIHDLVYNVINCDRPVIGAIHGPVVEAGLVTELLIDISIATKDARIVNNHTRLGVTAGDHAAIVWPLLYGTARAKYYLLLCESMTGEEAECIGLISLAVPESELVSRAFEVAERLMAGSQTAIRWTKYALNNWLHLAGPGFDTSLAFELMGFAGPDMCEGIASLCQKHSPVSDDT